MRPRAGLSLRLPTTAGVLAILLAAGPLAAATGDDCIPPQWTGVQIDFKATWDETLAANPDSAQAARIQADPALRGAASQVLALWKIHRLEAMMQHFPTATDKFPDAYRTIADTWAALGDRYQRTAWLLKLVSEFPQRKDLLPAACRDMIDLPFANATRQPEVLQWQTALQKVIHLGETATIDPADPAVLAAWTAWGKLLTITMQYDQLDQYFRRLQSAAEKTPALHAAAGATLASLGHLHSAAAAYELAKNPQAHRLGDLAPRGLLLALPRNRELEIRWKALTRNPDLAELQRVEPKQISGMLAVAADGAFLDVADAHYVSFWYSINRTLAVQNRLERFFQVLTIAPAVGRIL